MFKMDLEKAEEAEIKLPSVGSSKKHESSRKTSISALLNMPKPCVDHNKLTKVEDIKKRWQEYTEELYKKDLHDPDNHNRVKCWAG